MKQRKKRPVPPPPPVVVDDDKKPKHGDEAEEMPPFEMMSPLVDSSDPTYLAAHEKAQTLQKRALEEGYVLLKNRGALPLKGGKCRLNVFGRYSRDYFDAAVCEKYGLEINAPLQEYYLGYKTKDAGYTGSGWDEEKGCYVRQNRTSTGMFGGMGYLDPEPFIGHTVYNADGSARVTPIPGLLLSAAKNFSDTAAVVLYRKAGEGADHEKGDELLSEGEAAMLSFCSQNFKNTIVILATNSVIDGEFLEKDTVQKFYMYTYGGGVYSNNIGNEIQADYDSRVELKYLDEAGEPAPHVYPIAADKLTAAIYTCENPGDSCCEVLAGILTGLVSPSGRLMDEIVYDYDDNPVSLSCGGMVFSRASTGEDLYIYGHNYVAYKEGVYLGYKYFETFCPERVVYPFGYGLSYTDFAWKAGSMTTAMNEYGELKFSLPVTVTNIGTMAGREVVELYQMPPYYEEGKYGLEKALVSLCAFEKTGLLAPGASETVTLSWNARDIACYSDRAECYVLEKGLYRFCVAKDANAAHTAPAYVAEWELAPGMSLSGKEDVCWDGEDAVCFLADEVTGTRYRNLFTGSDVSGWRFDAKGTEKENIVYIHRTDASGSPRVQEGTYPEYAIIDERTRETALALDLQKRGLDCYYEMDATAVHFYDADIPQPTTNAVYRDEAGNRRNFMLQDVAAYLKEPDSPRYHNAVALTEETGKVFETWSREAEDAVWDRFLDQLSVNEMLCRFYHSGFTIPGLKEYGVPPTYSADTPGQIGANNAVKMFRTTRHNDTLLACTFNKELLHEFGLALGRETAASGEAGTTWFYAPGNNLHRSCLSGKNSHYWSEDSYLAGRACGYYLKGLEEGGVNGCLKHFACNDQEISREGLVVFSNEQNLRENYFGAFEEALKIGGGQGIMTSLGRVGTVNACGNGHLTVDLLRKEWGFDGMVITDGYGVTSYMYEINDMIGASSGLLCFGNSGNFGECRDYMELYRYYLAYPGRTIAALRRFMRGCMNGTLQSHTYRDLYRDYNYYASPERETSTDINWFDAEIGLGYVYTQADSLSYKGIKLMPGECNPGGMMPNTNCKDRSGTIATDDYGLIEMKLTAKPGESVTLPVSMQKCAGLSDFAFSLVYDRKILKAEKIRVNHDILPQEHYHVSMEETARGLDIRFVSSGNVFSAPCGKLFDLEFTVSVDAPAGLLPIQLLPLLNPDGSPAEAILDKQGHELSYTLSSQRDKYTMGSGWSGVYQEVESGGWYKEATMGADELADITLLSGKIEIL